MTLEIIGLLFSLIVGTIGHFLYDLLNNNKIIGFLFATNESTWQHLKLGITPILMWTIVESFILNGYCLFYAKFISIIVFVLILLTLYYSYKFIIKKNILIFDIMIFYLSLAFSYLSSIKLLSIGNCGFLNIIGLNGLLFIIISYNYLNKKDY